MSVGAVVACCALAVACSPNQAPASTPSLTPVATTPAESQIERQMRLDYEAAEEAYRASIAEQDRLARAGGVQRATAELEATADRRIPVFCGCAHSSLIERRAGWSGAVAPRSWVSWQMAGWQEKQVGF